MDYLERFRECSGERFDLSSFHIEGDSRDNLVLEYAWAIPTPEAIAAVVKHSPIVEMGAGTGYWASLIAKAGGDIIAFDLAPPANTYNPYRHKKEWHAVSHGDACVLSDYSDGALLLCWPPYNTDMAERCLKHWTGKTLIYVGEGPGGCTGSDKFFDTLHSEFTGAEDIELPNWFGIHDGMEIWQRK